MQGSHHTTNSKVPHMVWPKKAGFHPNISHSPSKWITTPPPETPTKSCEVPSASMTTLCVREMCTPSSLWIPQHSKHIITPRLVDNHSGSVYTNKQVGKETGCYKYANEKVRLFFLFLNPSLLLCWMFEHDCLDTCCFGCLICMCFIYLYWHLFSTTEHVSHGMTL